MFAKTLLVAAVSASLASAYSMPACWETCFEKYNVESEGCLCSAPIESVVTNCISVGCSAANSSSSIGAYEGWLSSYCGEGPVTTTEISTAYTTVCPLTMTSGESTWTSSWTTSTVSTVWTTTVPATTTETWGSTPVTSTVSSTTATTWTSGAVTTSTWVPTTWVVTMTPGVNTWTGTNSVPQTWTAPAWTSPVSSGYVPGTTAPVTTAPVTTSPPSVTPPPYVAGAAGLKVGGVLGAVGAVAALVL